MEAENGAERAQPGLRNGHSCVATVAISASNCGSFASSMGLNEKGSGLFRRFKADFSPWLESFCGGDFVNTIRHHPASGIGCIFTKTSVHQDSGLDARLFRWRMPAVPKSGISAFLRSAEMCTHLV